MKLMGVHNQRKKDGSASNSSRTSPSKLEDAEFVKNSLLESNNHDFNEEALTLKVSGEAVSGAGQGDKLMPRENSDMGRVKMQPYPKGDGGNLSTIHPVRILDEENLDYDSNASSSSFEFHKGEKLGHGSITRSLSRPMSSKWNDAEKWIMNRQNAQVNYTKRTLLHNQANRLPINMVRVVPESVGNDHKLMFNRVADTKRVDFCQSVSQTGLEKFSFVPAGTHTNSGQANGANTLFDPCPESKDLMEVGHMELSCTPAEDTTDHPAIRAVSMRDMGTEMTPVESQEPSRATTPAGATTPLRSPTSSLPSTPRRGAPAPTPMEHTIDNESRPPESSNKELSEQELKLKTRREIVDLGVQLGKMNIAAWASKDEKEKNISPVKTIDQEKLDQIEFERRAAAWEEVEKSKHTARCKREEIEIQAWESQQKAKLEAEMRRIEAKVEQMRAHAQAKMVKKIAMARQKSEEKRAAAEARKNRQAERTAAQAEYIRQTGQIPSSHFPCCGWLR